MLCQLVLSPWQSPDELDQAQKAIFSWVSSHEAEESRAEEVQVQQLPVADHNIPS